ncbi:methyltransferase domain-containing protein [Streptomyces sp. NPDC058751]|uniref:methyltransferase domain-containing protein n=1 Tax=Streptomyces sp. NPDC058751 TaxID=3346623 RepID=UPI0036766557
MRVTSAHRQFPPGVRCPAVGAGADSGSYEDAHTVLAVEPSPVMIAQRPPGGAPAVRAVAERLPLADGCADAVAALLTVHHWSDVAADIAELLTRRSLDIGTGSSSPTPPPGAEPPPCVRRRGQPNPGAGPAGGAARRGRLSPRQAGVSDQDPGAAAPSR